MQAWLLGYDGKFGTPIASVICYSIPEMADDAVAFLDALDIPRATLVGHSFGSFVAARRAVLPDRARRLHRRAADRGLTIYAETGHCPNWEQPERVAADIAALVARS